jgi:GT2 family glycosyltransferase
MRDEANQPLVSIIIPCYNCKKWVSDSIESCFNQTYSNIEIIVVDDGSTDGSLELLRQFVPRITLETGPNRGGNRARNRGFALSKGEYIQFLDSDDYLESEKIARQVAFLEETKADVVYGDWRYRRHLADTRISYLDKIEVRGSQQDIVASLLSLPWFVNGGAALYRRQAVNQVGGWDETLRAAQDIDFFTSIALSGAKIRYQPGCYFIYRNYGAVTTSTSNLSRWVESVCASLQKSEAALARASRLTDEYRSALATGYFELARACYWFDARASFAVYADRLDDLTGKILDLSPNFNVTNESRVFLALQSLLGFKFTMHFLPWIRAAIHAVKSMVKSELKKTFLFGLVLRIKGVSLQQGAQGEM